MSTDVASVTTKSLYSPTISPSASVTVNKYEEAFVTGCHATRNEVKSILSAASTEGASGRTVTMSNPNTFEYVLFPSSVTVISACFAPVTEGLYIYDIS